MFLASQQNSFGGMSQGFIFAIVVIVVLVFASTKVGKKLYEQMS